MSDLQKDFNSGKDIDYVKNGGSPYEKFKMTVADVSIILGGSNDNPLVKACDKKTELIEFTIKGEAVSDPKRKISFNEYQALKKDDEGNYKSYIFDRFEGNDGTIVPGTLCHDILHLAYDYDDKQREERESLAFSQKKFLGLIFIGEAKVLDNGNIIFLTDRRRLKDEQYREGKKRDEEIYKQAGFDEEEEVADEDMPDFLKNKK